MFNISRGGSIAHNLVLHFFSLNSSYSLRYLNIFFFNISETLEVIDSPSLPTRLI